MTDHVKNVCKCGTVIRQCRCPGPHKIVVEDVCAHDWATALENELDEQYSIPSHAVNKMYSRWLEVELPATRHTLNVSLTNIYGFVITLSIHDETGGLIKEIDLYSCVGINNLADTIDSIYGSYGE